MRHNFRIFGMKMLQNPAGSIRDLSVRSDVVAHSPDAVI
jgi:hypothetical protein